MTTRGGPFPGVSAATIHRRAEKMAAHLELGAVELSIALVDDRQIQELNRTYQHKDKPTDVLAFPMDEVTLGDVIISVDTARRQAKQRRRPVLDELTMLLGHGLLHLLGYDHQTDEEEREMTARTRALEVAAGTPTVRKGVRGIQR